MPTIKEVKMELRHREWADQIAECQIIGISVRNGASQKDLVTAPTIATSVL